VIPEKLNIGGISYTIDRDNNEYLAGIVNVGVVRMGEYDSVASKISLRKGLNPDVTLETLAHEILHALLNHCGTDLPQNEEEALVQRITNPFFRFLVDNDLSFFRGT
jgi:hypothetical protein